jgi:hypothetical protein
MTSRLFVILNVMVTLLIWSMSVQGALIGPHILITALHVATEKNCRDSETNSPLTIYKRDDKHDLALVTSPALPTDIPYYKITCSKFVTGRKYLSYGITPYGQKRPILRDNIITATKNYTDILDLVGGTPAPGMREFDGAIAPGMSGGPVVDPENGLIYAVNNAGSESDTLLYELADGMMCKK